MQTVTEPLIISYERLGFFYQKLELNPLNDNNEISISNIVGNE